jgi:hypothetical protein
MDTMMTLDRFSAIVDAYGGSPARWPQQEREAAVAFMKSSAEAQRLAQEAEGLDGLLDTTQTAPATRELQARILSTLPNAKGSRWAVGAGDFFAARKWIPAAAVACSLVLGAATGMQLPRFIGLDDESLALQAASSAMAAGSDDGEIFGGSE